jgi:hypothetical protein
VLSQTSKKTDVLLTLLQKLTHLSVLIEDKNHEFSIK